jgi:hypothetical protein
MMDGSGWLAAPSGRIITVEARLAHIRLLVPALRAEDRAEIEAQGFVPRHLLFRLWRWSSIRRTVFVDGEIAAIWGCEGAALARTGKAWLYTTPQAERVPIGFLKTARAGIRLMQESHPVLISDVDARYERSIRFMTMLGFHVGEPYQIPSGAFLRRLTLGA